MRMSNQDLIEPHYDNKHNHGDYHGQWEFTLICSLLKKLIEVLNCLGNHIDKCDR